LTYAPTSNAETPLCPWHSIQGYKRKICLKYLYRDK
jgi:hypothetical protein